jgi:hypothetical protein
MSEHAAFTTCISPTSNPIWWPTTGEPNYTGTQKNERRIAIVNVAGSG